MKAIKIEEFGGPEVLQYVDVPDPVAGDGEVLVDIARAGVNFADTHATRNDYLAEQSLPMIPGGEVSGRTSDGRRVAALLGGGGYAQKVAVPEALLVPVPDQVDDDQAAALLLQGLTAMALVRVCARVEAGETVVVEAAAGAPDRSRSRSRSAPERASSGWRRARRSGRWSRGSGPTRRSTPVRRA